LTIKSWVVGSRRILEEKCVMNQAPKMMSKNDQKQCHTQKLLKIHQNRENAENEKIYKTQKVTKSDKIKIIKNRKSDKIKITKLIKKVSKMVKKSKTLFLGRKRKRRGSMRFYKNVRTRCLGFHIK